MTSHPDKRKNRYIFTILFFWLIIVSSSLFWNLNTVQKGMERTLLNIGRSFFNEIETTRLWNARHGGVYVPITDQTQPNPYLDIHNRDVTTTNGIALTKINPAYMTRQISEISRLESNIQYHITSLKPIRPANKADGWESASLFKFESGAREIFQYIPDVKAYRYMAPLFVKKACLQCHIKQGYKSGDIRGGISIKIPATVYITAIQKSKTGLILIHILALLLGGVLFYLLNRYRDKQEERIHRKNKELEREISSRKAAEAEKEKLEAKLRQVHKMEAIGTMAGGIAHKFNNIIGIIIGYAEMVEEEIPAGNNGEFHLKRIVVAAMQAKELIDHIVSFSNQATLIHNSVKLNVLLHEYLSELKNNLPSNISVIEEIDRTAKLVFIAPEDFMKVAMNLCKNALDAMSNEGGTLRIIVQNRELTLSDLSGELAVVPGSFVEFSVSDSGHGITEDNMERIFDPFFTTKEIGEGDGVGLSVVSGIVRKCGGMMRVESKPGQGSTFYVFLPTVKLISKIHQ